MENQIKSWLGKQVRLKREWIKEEQEIDEDQSDWDEDTGTWANIVYKTEYVIDVFGLRACVDYFEDAREAVFNVQSDFYGVDLFYTRSLVEVSELPEPSHQIIIKETGYPYMWDAKYFEIVD
jgi:hypothetical protein